MLNSRRVLTNGLTSNLAIFMSTLYQHQLTSPEPHGWEKIRKKSVSPYGWEKSLRNFAKGARWVGKNLTRICMGWT